MDSPGPRLENLKGLRVVSNRSNKCIVKRRISAWATHGQCLANVFKYEALYKSQEVHVGRRDCVAKEDHHLFPFVRYLVTIAMIHPAIGYAKKACEVPETQFHECDFVLSADGADPYPEYNQSATPIPERTPSTHRPAGSGAYADFIHFYPKVIEMLGQGKIRREDFPKLIRSDVGLLQQKWKAIQEKTIAPSGSSPNAEPPKLNEKIVICLKPGVYNDFLEIKQKVNLEIRGLRCRAQRAIISPTQAPPAFLDYSAAGTKPIERKYRASVYISDSKNIKLHQLRIRNKHQDLSNVYRDPISGKTIPYLISRGIVLRNSQDILLERTTITTKGKCALSVFGSTVGMLRTTLQGYYFLVDAESSLVAANRSTFNLKHLEDPNDTHAAFWTDHSDFYLGNSSYNFQGTGKTLFSGINATSDERLTHELVLYGESQVSGNEFWLTQQEGLGGLRLSLYGKYSPYIKDLWVNRWRDPAKTPLSCQPNSVHKLREPFKGKGRFQSETKALASMDLGR